MNALSRRVLEVLLVDDNPDDRALVRGKLRSNKFQKYQFNECSTAEEGLAWLQKNPLPDCLILDMHMPLRNGIDFLKALKEVRGGTIPLPVIMLTGSGLDEELSNQVANEAIFLGAQDYITKESMQPEPLVRTVYNAIERFRLSQNLQEKQEEYRLAIEASQLGVWSYEPGAKRFYCSERSAEIMGLAAGQDITFAIFLEKIYKEDRTQAELQFLEVFEQSSDLGLKIEYRVERDGRLYCVSARGRVQKFGGHNGRLMGTLLDVTERKRSESQRREEMEMLDAIYRTGQAFSRISNPHEPVQHATDIATELTKAEFGAFFYNSQNATGESYMLYTLSGAPLQAFADFPMPRKTQIFAPTFDGTGVVRSDDITTDPRYGKNSPYHGMPEGHIPVKSYLAVPVVTKGGEVLGGLFFGHSQPGIFTERSERIAKAIASQAAIGLENGRLVQANEKQRRLYETILSSTPDFVYIFDLNYKFVYLNESLLAMFGKTRGEATNKGFPELGYEPWHVQMHHDEIDTVVKTKKPIRGEVPFAGTNGRRIYDYIFVPVLNEEGEVEFVAGTTRDITEARAQEAAIKKNEERQRLALAASHDFGIWDWDVVNDRFTADERFGALFGLTAEQAKQGVELGRVVKSIHPEDYDRIGTHITKVLKEGGRYVDEYRVIPKPGVVRWLSVRGEVQFDENGNPVRFPGVGIDITAERETAIALQASEERWRNLADAMPQLLWTCRASDGQCEYMNSRWQQYTGEPVENLLGFAWVQWLHPEDRDIVMQAWTNAVQGRADYNLEYRIRRHDGAYRWFKTRGVPIRDPQGCITTWYGTCTDIQDNVEAKLQAEAANIAKTEFLANMSHEIRTPMNAVIGLANILSLSQPLTPRQVEFISTLQLSADSLLSLINDLLDISKIESRSVELEKIPFSLDQLMHEVISIMSVRAREKHLSFRSEAHCIEGRTYLGDPTRIRQVIMNLCSNAIKFTEHGSVLVSFTCEPTAEPTVENVTMIVEDTGIGIPTAKLGTIFHKFVQADTSINRKYGGTGLGLAISKTLVEIMGGEISVTSTSGKGSRFAITVPLQVVDARPEAEIEETSGRENSNAHHLLPRILLVEDYAPNVMVATAFLEEFGYRCEVAHNGLEALEKIKKESFAMVLMDVQMHGMNGLEATRLIREQEKQQGQGHHLPIIGMTAHALSGDRERCLGVGMDDYIAKPFNPEELRQKIALLLNTPA